MKTSDPDSRVSDRRRRVGRWVLPVVLVLLFLGGAVAATVVISLEAHFDCGGTFGGFGESASARLDETCVQARWWRVPLALAAMAGTTLLAYFSIRAVNPAKQTLAAVLVLTSMLVGWAAWLTIFVAV